MYCKGNNLHFICSLYILYSSSVIEWSLCRCTLKDYATPLDLATNDACRGLLEHQSVIYDVLKSHPAALVKCAMVHCAALSGKETFVLVAALRLLDCHLDPSFLCVPWRAQDAVFTCAKSASIGQPSQLPLSHFKICPKTVLVTSWNLSRPRSRARTCFALQRTQRIARRLRHALGCVRWLQQRSWWVHSQYICHATNNFSSVPALYCAPIPVRLLFCCFFHPMQTHPTSWMLQFARET